MIKMGRALAYDFNLLLPMLGLLYLALTAACVFADKKPDPPGASPKKMPSLSGC